MHNSVEILLKREVNVQCPSNKSSIPADSTFLYQNKVGKLSDTIFFDFLVRIDL